MAKSAPALQVQWHDGRSVGKLVVPGVTYFGYDEAWLASGYSLSPLTVPFTSVVFRQRADGFDQLPGFLSDCLPDQWGRRLMARDFRELRLDGMSRAFGTVNALKDVTLTVRRGEFIALLRSRKFCETLSQNASGSMPAVLADCATFCPCSSVPVRKCT